MNWLDNLLGKKQSANAQKGGAQVEFDASGKVARIQVPQGKWKLEDRGQNKYYSQNASSLLQATEILKNMVSIPSYTYYIVETPDGSLGRDIDGFYTEGPLKTENLVVDCRRAGQEAVEFVSLKEFGDRRKSLQSIAILKQNGRYARLVLLMKCGACGYESPVETEAGDLTRTCYCCGATNKGGRAGITVIANGGIVQV